MHTRIRTSIADLAHLLPKGGGFHRPIRLVRHVPIRAVCSCAMGSLVSNGH